MVKQARGERDGSTGERGKTGNLKKTTRIACTAAWLERRGSTTAMPAVHVHDADFEDDKDHKEQKDAGPGDSKGSSPDPGR